MTPRPLLVIVSGAPGAGKSTIVRQLAPALGLPLIAKDDIKETLGDALPPRSAAESRALGTATVELMFHLAEQLLEAGVGLVLESNFYRGVQEEAVQPLLERAIGVLIHCYVPPELALRRYEDRFRRGERHPVHFEEDTIRFARDDGLQSWTRWFAEPMQLSIPTLVLDTTQLPLKDVAPVLAFVDAARERPEGK